MEPNELLTAPEPKTRAEAAGLHQKIHAAAKAIFAKGDDATAADLAAFDALRTRGDAVKAFLEKGPDSASMKSWVDDQEKFIRTPSRPVPVDASGKFGVEGFQKAGHVDLDEKRNVLDEVGPAIVGAKAWDAMQDPTYRKAFFGEYLRKGERMSAGAYKALESGTDDQGGYFAPPQMIQRLVGRKAGPTNFAGMVDEVTTGSDAVLMTKVNYTANASDDPDGYIFPTGFRSTWGNERTDVTSTSAVTDANLFGTIRVPVYTGLITGRVTWQQAEDAGFDTQGWAEGKFGETIDLLYEQMALNGSGVGQPLGLVTAALGALPAGDPIKVITTLNAGSIVGDDIIEVSEDLPEQYDESCRWIYAKTKTNKVLRKLKDSQNRYLFANGTQDSGLVPGRQRTLSGYDVTFSQFMPSVATDNIPILFGDPKGYTRVVRLGFSIQVLREIEALKQRNVLLGRVRFGGAPLEPFRFRALKVQ